MDLVTLCPLATSKIVWQAHSGAFALTVIVKATFVLNPGMSTLASEQQPIAERCQFHDDDPRRGVHVPCEVVPYKPRADVVLVGRAYAPDKQSASSLVTRVVVGDMHKAIEMRFDGSSTWPGRTKGFGSLSTSSLADGWNNKPLPVKFDPRFFQIAPPDQQVAEIRPDERIILENLHPAHPQLVTSLPNLHPRAVADRATGEREEVKLVGDTLWIDTDRGVCCVVWRGRMGLRSREEAGRIAVWVDGMPMVESASARQGGVATSHDPDAATTTIGLSARELSAVLPFIEGTPKLALTNRSLAFDIARWVDQKNPPSPHEEDGTGTMFVSAEMLPREALPFGHKGTGVDVPGPHGGGVPVKPPFDDVQPQLDVPMLGYYEKKSTVGAPLLEASDHESPKQVELTPPPMIGPISVSVTKDRPIPVVVPDEKPVAAEDKPKSEPATPAAKLTIEQTAFIAAELAEGTLERARILHAHALLEPEWKENATRWNRAMSAEQSEGQTALRGAYDAAYVQRVEAFRGPITVQEYAALSVSFERRTCDAILSKLRIQSPALMPIMRVWAKKVACDVGLGKEAITALRTARRA